MFFMGTNRMFGRPTASQDRFGIRCVVFMGLHIGLDELRRDELNRVSELHELAGREMRATAGFHPDEAGRQLSKTLRDLRSLQLLA
jgi:hypothetical protein